VQAHHSCEVKSNRAAVVDEQREEATEPNDEDQAGAGHVCLRADSTRTASLWVLPYKEPTSDGSDFGRVG